MTIIVHDSRPDRSDHFAAEISYQAVIAFLGTEIIRVHTKFRFLDDVPRWRLRTLRYEDSFIQEVLQQISFTLAKTADHIFFVFVARHVGNTLITHPAQHLKHLFTNPLRLVVVPAAY